MSTTPVIAPGTEPATSPPGTTPAATGAGTGGTVFDPVTNVWYAFGSGTALSSGGFSTGSTADPSNSSPMANYGIAGAFNVTPVFKEPSRTLTFPDPNKLVTFVNRYLPRIKEKSGVATFTVFSNGQSDSEKKAAVDADKKAGEAERTAKTDAEKTAAAKSREKATAAKENKGGNKQYSTINFFAQGVSIERSESVSIVKTNKGFTLYSPDSNPVGLSLTGTLLNGNDWSTGSDRASITHTDWVSKFLSDYDSRLSSTASIRNNQTIFFSFQNIFAEVHVVSIGTAVSGDDPLISPLRVSMVCKELRFTFRPDISGTGADVIAQILKIFADLSAAGEKKPQVVSEPSRPNTGFSRGSLVNFTPNIFYNTGTKADVKNITTAAQNENRNSFLKIYTRPGGG